MLTKIQDKVEDAIFRHRPLVIVAFLAVTAFMAYSAKGIHIDAGFAKLLPLQHEYMQTYTKHRSEFGGANRLLIALMAKEGDIFTAEYMEALKAATDEVFFIAGVDRARVSSLFTPNTRFTEVVEDGISGGNVVPAEFAGTPEDLAQVRENILKAGIVGRLVANDFSGAIISAQLLEINPDTGEPLNYIDVANQLEEKIRQRFEEQVDVVVETSSVDVHMIGFAKVIGDIANGAGRVLIFFLVAFFITGIFLYLYSSSFRMTMIVLACSLVAVIWQIGLLTLLGFGIDPMGILVPFLVFAIGVSHGVQMITAVRAELVEVYVRADREETSENHMPAEDALEATRKGCRRLILPGVVALASDTVGFITILLINIRVIREMAITASLGVATIILTNLVLLPVVVSYLKVTAKYRRRLYERMTHTAGLWRVVAKVAERKPATVVVAIAVVLTIFGAWKARDIKIGDLHRGVPELRSDSRYNVDSEIITDKFSIGVDILTAIVETKEEGCVEYEIMNTIDSFEWHMRNVPGVQSVVGLPGIARVINAGWNEGGLKWRVLSRNQSVLVQSIAYIPTSTGLLNEDCSVMPVMMFTTDHKAETIEQIVAEVKAFNDEFGSEDVQFRLATGNVGVMAATNEAVSAAQFPMLIYVFAAIIVLCLLGFRSLRGTLCVVLPLGLVSLLAYALMTILEIGLKVSTLPVVALGVGIGVDYGIYIYSRLKSVRAHDHSLPEAYLLTLSVAGNGVLFTGITLAVGVATWIFSPLKFQADMGILLTFMFLVNMLGAILLLPALESFLIPDRK
ncbi:MAG: RND family transporter [Thermoanaerobaculia bacterium]